MRVCLYRLKIEIPQPRKVFRRQRILCPEKGLVIRIALFYGADHGLPEGAVDTLMDQHEGMRVPADLCEDSVPVHGFVNERFPVLVREHVVIQNGLLVDAEREEEQDGGGSRAVFSLCAVEEQRGFFI